MTMKSGTNSLHGTLFEFLRNDKFDAEHYFLNFQRPANQPRLPKDKLRRNQFKRQLCSKRMPDSLRSLGDLVQRAGSFRPFERLEILAGTSIPTIDQVGVRKGLLGRGFLWLIEERLS
jgi:hypothetical protein